MAFNYATGAYEPDQPQQVQPTMDDWYRLSGFGAGGANPNINYASQAGGGGAGVPGQLNGGGIDTPPATPTRGVDLGNQNNQAPAPNMPNYDNPYVNMGQVLTPQTEPANPAQQSPLQIFSQNAGTTYGNPTLPGDFWSNTAGHYVDPTYGTDASGRVLSDAEKQYWQGYDHARASGTLDSYLKTVTNPGLAAGTQATYAPGVATTTIPGRTLDQTGAPGAAAAGVPGAPGAAAAQVQYNPLDPAWDYSKTQSVPWQAFVKNLFGENNANQLGFNELKGVLTPEQINQAATLYGWQGVDKSMSPDANAVYRMGIQAAQADPGTDYVVVRTTNPQDGTLQYGIMKRSQSTATQEAGGFYAPGSTNPNSPANQARARATRAATLRSQGGGGRSTGGGTVTGTGGGGGLTPDKMLNGPTGRISVTQLQDQVSGQLNAQAQLNAYYKTHPAAAVPLAPGGMTQADHDAQLAAQKKLLDAMTAGAGGVTAATPGMYNGQPTKPAPAGNPPEGAIRVNPDDSRSVWRNGAWRPIPGINS